MGNGSNKVNNISSSRRSHLYKTQNSNIAPRNFNSINQNDGNGRTGVDPLNRAKSTFNENGNNEC